MAFVCTVGSQSSSRPGLAATSSQTSVVFPIGYDDDDGRIYQLFVSFGRAPGGIIEYSFCITCIHNDGVLHRFLGFQGRCEYDIK
jgi:hypothetical protein